MMNIHGQCHCGNLHFDLSWPTDTGEIPARACRCSFCTKHGGVYTSHPEATLDAHIEDRAAVNKYTFGTGTAEFFVCSRCGVVPFVTSNIDGSLFGVVNVNTFDPDPTLTFDCGSADFDGEDTESRLARRRRTWISKVRVFGDAGYDLQRTGG